MKKFGTILVALIMSVAMLAPDCSLLQAVYADDETPAATQTTDCISDDTAASAETGENTDDPNQNLSEEQTLTDNEGEPTDEVDGDDPTPTDPTVITDSYDKVQFTELDDQGGFVIPEDLQEAITKSHTEYGNGVLLNGTIQDLNALKITIGEFNFDSGSVGRITFDGLKDKDIDIKANVLIYIDDNEEPVGTIALKKQMGKHDWANDGELTFSLGSAGITGTHTVSIGLNITGKKPTSKTSVSLRSLQFFKTTLPVLYFNIDESEGTIEAMNSSEDHSVECYGNVDLIVPNEFNNDTTFRDEYGTQKSLTALKLEYIRGRGNSTWSEDKRPYKVKLDKKQNLFGFGANKHWILLANRFDNSLVRNRMTYWLGQQLEMPYTPQCVPVEVVMNGDYYGSYLLAEQIRVGEGRVTIDDLDDVSDDPPVTDPIIETGGYLLSLDYAEDEARTFKTSSGQQFYIESPDEKVSTYYDYIKAYTQKVENAIMSENFKDEAGHPYTDYLDIDQAVDYWWVQEFSVNGDAYGSGSTYLYKARDTESDTGNVISKLCWGPLWDFDYVAWGDLDYEPTPDETLDNTDMPWFEAMKADPDFIDKVKTRWNEAGGLKDKINDIVKEGGLLDKYLAQMETSYNYDHELWGAFQSPYNDYKDEINQLRDWIQKRAAYVDQAVKELDTDPHTIQFMIDGELVKETTVIGRIREKDFPDVPEKDGMIFESWLTEDGYTIEPNDIIHSDLVLTAEYISKEDLVEAKDIFFRSYDVYVEFDEEFDFDWFDMSYTIVPDDAYDTSITWTSSDESIAEIDKEYESVRIKGHGDVVLTGTLSNGVSKSINLHIVPYTDFNEFEGIELSTDALTVKEDEYAQVVVTAMPQPCEPPDIILVSIDENIATVDEIGVIKGISPGTTEILVVDTYNNDVKRVKVTVTSADVGKTVTSKGNTYKITTDTKSKKRCMLIKAKNAKKVTIPASIKYHGKTFKVNKINAKAFAKSKKVRTVTVKTKLLTKASVKNSLKGSKVKTIKVKVGKKKVNKKYVKKYRKYFKKKNSGKKVKVK